MVIDGKPHIRPCRSIPNDGNENNNFIASIGDLYAPLTRPLPLAGASALPRSGGGKEPRIAATLRAEMPWMAAAIDRIADQTAFSLWAGRPWLAIRPMLLVRPPGAGKTHLARRLGTLSGCGDAVLSFAGVSSSAELAGNARGFRHQQPNFAAMTMLRTGSANPVIVIGEIEKAACGDMGDPVLTLLGMLERSTAGRFLRRLPRRRDRPSPRELDTDNQPYRHFAGTAAVTGRGRGSNWPQAGACRGASRQSVA